MKILQLPYRQRYATKQHSNIFSDFINWSAGQENFRYGWLAIGLFSQGCLLAPITLLISNAAGNSMVSFCFAIAAMAAVLVVNLAAMPTKITVPVFFFSVLIDLVIIVSSVVSLVS